MGDYSLSDIAAASGNEGFGGNMGYFWIFALLLLANGGIGFGNRGDYGQYATAASQQDILFSSKFSDLDNKIDRGFTSIGNGIADSTFALNNSIRNAQDAVGSEGRAIQSQLADCCCGIKEAVHAEGEQTRAMLQQNKIEALQARINSLELAQATATTVKYPTQTTWSMGTNPYCGCNAGF